MASAQEEKAREVEMGTMGTRAVWASALAEVRNCAKVAISEIQEMCRVDPLSASLLNAILQPISAAEWNLTPARDGARAARLVQDVLTRPAVDGGMQTPFGDVLRNLMLAVRDGVEVLEKVWTVGDDGVVRLRKLAPRPTTTLAMRVDEHGELVAVRQRTGALDATMPREKIVIHVVGHADNPWWGQSVFAPGYFAWTIRRRLYYVAALAFSLAACPHKVAKVPRSLDAKTKRDLLERIDSLGTNSTLLVPETISIEVLEGKRPLSDLQPFIQHIASIQSQATLTQFLLLGSEQARGGSWALADVQRDPYESQLNAYLASVAITINTQVIPDICRFNGIPIDRRPVFGFKRLSGAIGFIEKNFAAIVQSPDTALSPELRVEIERLLAQLLGVESIDYDELRRRLDEQPANETPAAAVGEEPVVAWAEVTHQGQVWFAARAKDSRAIREIRARGQKRVRRAMRQASMRMFGEWSGQLARHLEGKLDVLQRIIERRQRRSESMADDDLVEELFRGLDFSTSSEALAGLRRAEVTGYEVGAKASLDQLGVRRDFNLRNEDILRELDARANHIGGATDEVFDSLKARIRSGQLGGDNPLTFARRIRAEMGDISRARSELIARTESAVLMNSANAETMRRSGADGEEWLTAGDDKVREEHARMSGEIRVFPAVFSNGDGYVGESSPYNCRCAGAPVVRDPDQIEPWDGS